MARRSSWIFPSRNLIVVMTMISKRSFITAFPSLSSGFPHRRTSPSASFRSSTACRLNRFLFSPNEVETSNCVPLVNLSKDDYRTVHASKILGVRNGDAIRAGVVSSDNQEGLITDTATIEWIPEGMVLKSKPLRDGDPPGSLRIHLNSLRAGPSTLSPSNVSLILALPRPIQLARMLPMISQMGVDHLILTEACKVPKDYFGSHLFRNPRQLNDKLVEGLCQAGDVKMPNLRIVRHLNYFLEHDLDGLFPSSEYARVVAHPQRSQASPLPKLRHVRFPSSPRKMVVAVGPEGGWEEPNELNRFGDLGFEQVTMGERTLRSDCAVIGLLTLAHDVCDTS